MNKQQAIITIIILFILFLISQLFNGIEYINKEQGFYINVKQQVYNVFKPLEQITNYYIQVDCE